MKLLAVVMLVVVFGLDSAVNAFHLGGPQKRQQDDDLLTSTDPSISSQEVVLPSSLTDPDTPQIVVPPFLTVVTPQVDFVPSSTNQTVSDDNLLGNSDDCHSGKDCDDHKKPEYLLEYENERDKKGYHYRYKTSKNTEVSQNGKLVKNQHGTRASSATEDAVSVIPVAQTGGLDSNIVRDDDTTEKEPSPTDTLLIGTHHEHGHGDEDDQVIIMEGYWEYSTPDCYRVRVKYEAGFDGFIVKENEVKKIKDCRPHNDHDNNCAGHPGATIDRHGNRCLSSSL